MDQQSDNSNTMYDEKENSIQDLILAINWIVIGIKSFVDRPCNIVKQFPQ